MAVSPVLFMGAVGYFVYLADRERFRSAALAELRRIMSFANLDNTYHIEDWFLKKNRLLIHVAKKGQGKRTRLDLPFKGTISWLGRKISGLP
jgi:hypothetical protein